MPRKSHIDKVLEELADIKDVVGLYVVIYGFDHSSGEKISRRFYDNLERLNDRLGGVRRVQRGVYECGHLKTALAIKGIAEIFKAKDVVIYRVEKIED